MSTPAFEQGAFFTPSYSGDAERAVLLRRSIERHCDDQAKHFLAVPRHEISLFKAKLGNDSSIIYVAQEDLVEAIFYPKFLYRVTNHFLPSQSWRFESWAGRPGWIIQQIAKMQACQLIPDGAIIFLDSDVIFYRKFDFSTLGIKPESRTLIKITPQEESAKHRKRIARAREMLKLPAGPTEHNYMGSPVIWYADWSRALQEHITAQHTKPWQQVLYEARFISEYSLYGVFVEEVLKPTNLLLRTTPYYRIVWDDLSLRQFKADLSSGKLPNDHTLCAIIQSNIGASTTEYEDVISRLLSSPVPAMGDS